MPTPELIDKANDAISLAILHLMKHRSLAFDVSIICNLKRKFVDAPNLIAAINETTLLINPEAFLSQSLNDQMFILRHEAWHIIGFDAKRLGDKNHQIWNVACDHWINLMIKHDPGCDLEVPDGCCCDEAYHYLDKEEIYEQLVLKANQDDVEPSRTGSDDPLHGDFTSEDVQDSSNQGENSEEENSNDLEIEQLVTQAALQAKAIGGDIPVSVQEYLDELYNPKLNWAQILAKYMDSYSTHDYCYRRLNKKFLFDGLYLPTAYAESVGEIIVATDESSSVSDTDYKLYIGAIEEIIARFDTAIVSNIGFTTRVNHYNEIKSRKQIEEIRFRSYGGTHIPIIFDFIKEKKIHPRVLIVFSDMESRMPVDKPNYDVIWISVNNRNFVQPFGKVIYV